METQQQNIEYALSMAYLRTTSVLIRTPDVTYEMYDKLKGLIKIEMNRLSLEMNRMLAA